MSDYKTAQDAAAFIRMIDGRIDKAFRNKFAEQSGIVPGVAYSSVMFDSFGRARWGGEGGGGGGGVTDYVVNTISAGTSYSASTLHTLSTMDYTATANGYIHYDFYFRAGTTTWTAGDEFRLYEKLPGDTRILKLETIQATRSQWIDGLISNTVQVSNGDALEFILYHTRTGGSITVDLAFVSIVVLGDAAGGGGTAGARVYASADQSIADSTTEILSFDTVDVDDSTFYDAGDPTRLTAPSTGWYHAAADVDWESNGTGRRLVDLFVNGTEPIGRRRITAGGTGSLSIGTSTPIYLTAGDYVEVEVWQNSGGALNVRGGVDGGGYKQCSFSLVGPL